MNRSFFVALGTGVLVLLLIAASSLYWILSQSPLNLLKGGTFHQPSATIFVPRQSPVMVSLLVNPERLEAFGELAATPAQRRRSQLEFAQLKESLLANTGLDYQTDIQPWLGDEITLAVTDLDVDRNPENGVQPGYLLAVNTKDPELAREFLQLSFSQEAIAGTSDLVFEQYKGVNLIYQRSLEPSLERTTVTSAVVGDFVLFANTPKVLREAINNVQATDLSLKSSSSYQEALQTIESPRIGIAYANLPALSAWVVNAPASETEAQQLLTVAMSLQSGGLAAQTALIGVAGDDQEPALSTPVEALQYVPANSVLTAAGTDLNQLWQQIETGIDPNSPLKQLFSRGISALEAPLGLNLPEEIFSWVQGEYALSLVWVPQQQSFDWVFVAQKVPSADVEGAVTELDNLAKVQGLSVGTLALSERDVTAWTKLVTVSDRSQGALRLDAQVQGVHTSTEQYEIFTTSLETIAQALGKTDSLLQTQKWKAAIAPLPSANDGYFFIDWREGEPIFEQQFPLIQVIKLAGKPLFNHLQSLGISSQGSKNGIRRATVFFNLEAN